MYVEIFVSAMTSSEIGIINIYMIKPCFFYLKYVRFYDCILYTRYTRVRVIWIFSWKVVNVNTQLNHQIHITFNQMFLKIRKIT